MASVIYVGNSVSTLDVLPEILKKVSKDLSYVTDAKSTYYSGGFPKRISLVSKNNTFPTGLLDRAKKSISSCGENFVVVDKRSPPRLNALDIKLDLKGTVPYPEQEEAAQEAIKRIRCGVVLPTGCGKSLVVVLLIAKLKVRTLVVVPSLELKQQLTDTISHYFGADALEHIHVKNIDSPSLKEDADYDCLIIDEAHHSAAKTYRDLNTKYWNKIYFRFFLTATFFRNNDEEELLFESIAGVEAYRVGYAAAVAKGYIVPVQAFAVVPPSQPEVKGRVWPSVYKEGVVNNKIRNVFIANMITDIEKYRPSSSVLCLVKEIEHGKALSALTGVPFANGQDSMSSTLISSFKNEEIRALIGTVGVLAEGVDTKPCDWVIIAGLGKAKSSIMQAVGRAVRRHGDKTSAKIVLIKDTWHRWAVAHFKAQKKIMKDEYGALTPELVPDRFKMILEGGNQTTNKGVIL